MADSHDPNDPGQRPTHTDDPELEKVKEDTAQIFVQFVRLHSHSASSNAAVIERICPDSSPTEPPSRPCLQAQAESSESRSAAAGPSTLPRQKSTDAARKDPHPKAVYSTRQPTAQIVANPHCSVEASAPVSQPTSKSRPDKLSLAHVHKRVPSATGSDSSGKTTPAQDPPMELISPNAELSSSYPPLSTARSDDREWLIRSADHTTVAAASSSASCSTSQERGRHLSSAVSIMHASCWLCTQYCSFLVRLQYPI